MQKYFVAGLSLQSFSMFSRFTLLTLFHFINFASSNLAKLIMHHQLPNRFTLHSTPTVYYLSAQTHKMYPGKWVHLVSFSDILNHIAEN